MYHIMSRGDRREKIFLTDVDRQDFIKTLAEACQKTGWQVHAYCLMPNHYHLVIETPEPNLVAGMAWLQSAYTIRLNHRHKLFGHVFSGRYKSQLVEGSGNGYLRTACNYVHLNPIRARMLKNGERLLPWPANCGSITQESCTAPALKPRRRKYSPRNSNASVCAKRT
jgi:putative transposase